MGLGQTMLTTMFLVLLTVAALTSYQMIDNQEANYYHEEAYRQAGILANELLQEIVRKKFDSQISDTANWGYMDTWEFDYPASLGAPSAAISYVNPSGADDVAPYKSISISPNTSRFDDVDDYKGYHRYADAGGLTGFKLSVDVYYVRRSSGVYVKVSNSGSPTYWKKVDVTVTNSRYLTTVNSKFLTNKDSALTYSTIVAY